MSNTVRAPVDELLSKITAHLALLWGVYFEQRYVLKNPVLDASLWGAFALGVLAFFTIGFNTLPYVFGVLALAWFVGCTVLHGVLWFAGVVYRNGILGTVFKTGLVLVGVPILLLSVFVLLFGGVVVGATFLIAAFMAPSPVGEILTPFAIIAYVVIACAWYARGIEYIDPE